MPNKEEDEIKPNTKSVPFALMGPLAKRETFVDCITIQCHVAYGHRELFKIKVKQLTEYTKLKAANFNTLERGELYSRVALKGFYTELMDIHAFIMTKISSMTSEYMLWNGYTLLGGERYAGLVERVYQANDKGLSRRLKVYERWTIRIAVLINTALEYKINVEGLFRHMESLEKYIGSASYNKDLEVFEASVKNYKEHPHYIPRNIIGNLWCVLQKFIEKRNAYEKDLLEQLADPVGYKEKKKAKSKSKGGKQQ